MFHRKDYMAAFVSKDDGAQRHAKYYGQFVYAGVVRFVADAIGVDPIINSKDEHLNDVPLARWDNLRSVIHSMCSRMICAANDNYGVSLSDTVCVAKQAGHIIKAATQGVPSHGLYIKSEAGPAVRITAVYWGADAANAHMMREGCTDALLMAIQLGKRELCILADINDKGF